MIRDAADARSTILHSHDQSRDDGHTRWQHLRDSTLSHASMSSLEASSSGSLTASAARANNQHSMLLVAFPLT